MYVYMHTHTHTHTHTQMHTHPTFDLPYYWAPEGGIELSSDLLLAFSIQLNTILISF
jgi:hypothetical protein